MEAPAATPVEPDLAEVHGQERAKRALEVAAAGGHNLLFVGPPGSGKTLLARRLPGILPPLELAAALEATRIHSAAGMLAHDALLAGPPFRAPHHSTSDAGMAGGGRPLRPGEISLAHRGVLFLDELPEFKRPVLEALRQPLEEGEIRLARSHGSVRLPARFQLVAAMNPCPCGWHGAATRECRCLEPELARYRAKLSGPLLDRIDLHVPVAPFPGARCCARARRPSRARGCASACAARERQARRYAGEPWRANAELPNAALAAHCRLDPAGRALFERAVGALGLSMRGFVRSLRLARTLADLDGADAPAAAHVAEALSFRSAMR
jgi:magnesium chelatase family protein